MAGLYHDFCVVENNKVNFSDFINHKENLRIHDDFINYIYDSLIWIKCINPACNNEEYDGLCLYGPTIIQDKSLLKFKKILSSWVSLFQEAPKEMTLTGYYIQSDEVEEGYYEKLKYHRDDLIEKLKQLISLCDEAYSNDKCLLHLGI